MKVRGWTIFGLTVIAWLVAYQMDSTRPSRVGEPSFGDSALFASYWGADMLVVSTIALFLTPALIREMVGGARPMPAPENEPTQAGLCCARCGSFDVVPVPQTAPAFQMEPAATSPFPIRSVVERDKVNSRQTPSAAPVRAPASSTSAKDHHRPASSRPPGPTRNRNRRAKVSTAR